MGTPSTTRRSGPQAPGISQCLGSARRRQDGESCGLNTSENEDDLRNHLVDKMLLVSAALGVIALACAQLRAFHIGWTYRDAVQILCVGFLVVPALLRKRFSVRAKALLMLVAFVLTAISGVHTLAMLGGGVFFFPAAAVLVALFYSPRATVLFVAFLLLAASVIAIGFSSGALEVTPKANDLIGSPLHWFIYVGAMGLFFAISCVTILEYRRAMGLLIARVSSQRDEIASQRDEIAASNEELVNALEDVKRLSGLLPICASCKNVRDDKGYWSQIEAYLKDHSEAQFSHGICPDCMKRLYPDRYKEVLAAEEGQ